MFEMSSNSSLKTGVSVRDPALRGSGECSHTGAYAALPPSPCALADGPMLVFQHPVMTKVSVLALLLLPRRLDLGDQLVDLAGLGEVVVGAELHGLQRRVDGAVPGEDERLGEES